MNLSFRATMHKVLTPLFFLLLPVLLIVSCSSAQENQPTAVIKGNLTVDESVDDSQDFSGFVVTVATFRDDRENEVFRAITDNAGYFEGVASFPEESEYVLFISRNQNRLASDLIVLADQDTLNISATFPDFDNTYNLVSVENDAYRVFRRLQRQFDRVRLHINSGQLSEEEIEQQINTWADLFWDVRSKYPNTLAASRAASSSIEALATWDDEKALARIEEVADDNNITSTALSVGATAKINSEGLDAAIAFMDQLKARTNRESQRINIDITATELLYDSLRIDQVKARLQDIKRDYSSNEDVISWANSMSFDVEVLAPGLAMPSFSLESVEEGYITNESLLGSFVMIEFVKFDSRTYQQQYEEMVLVYEQLADVDVEFVTVPAHDSYVTVNAFFSERPRPWLVADATEYQKDNLLEKLNIDQYPVRFLLDKEGKIVKKYYDTGYENILRDLVRLID